MRLFGKHFGSPGFLPGRSTACALPVVAVAAVSAFAVAMPLAASASGAPSATASHGICSSAKTPCHFSTPSGNIRCLWTPKPNNVACVMVSNGRAYRLRSTGKAKAIALKLATRGQTLPRNQQLVFPGSFSCRDTRRTMICNQDFLTGAFTLAAGHSHSS